MIDQKALEGVIYLLDDYAKIRVEDKVVIAYTKDSRESAAWVSHILELRKIDVNLICMKPLKDDGFFNRFVSVLPNEENITGKLYVITFELDTLSHASAIKKALSKYKETKCLVIRAMSACYELFSYALHVNPEELLARNATILERCMKAKKLRIKCSGGTDLTVHLNSDRFRWISNHGVMREGDTLILPAGEVATYPNSIEGTLIADFAFNVNTIVNFDARLKTNPVKVFVQNGKAVDFECENIDVKNLLARCFNMLNGSNVGELGFGTNRCVESAVSMNSHINERCPGIHLGFGQHNQLDILNYQCKSHLDLIAKGGLIWIDEDPLPLDLENIKPSLNPHPLNCRAEDAFAPDDDLRTNCCGVRI